MFRPHLKGPSRTNAFFRKKADDDPNAHIAFYKRCDKVGGRDLEIGFEHRAVRIKEFVEIAPCTCLAPKAYDRIVRKMCIRDSRRTDQHVAHADLAAAVALAVIARETLNQHAREFRFPIEEDSVVRNEYVIEDREGLYAAEFGVPYVKLTALQLTRIAGLAANNHKLSLIHI